MTQLLIILTRQVDMTTHFFPTHILLTHITLTSFTSLPSTVATRAVLVLGLCFVLAAKAHSANDPSIMQLQPIDEVKQTQQVASPQTEPANGLAFALQATMTHNPMVKGKQSEVQEQRFRVSSAQAQRYPTLSGGANNVTDDFNQATLRVDQPIWTFGRIDTAIEQAQVGVTAQQWQLFDVKRQLLEDTATAYIKIEGIRLRMAVAQANIEAHQRYFTRIERREEGQIASTADMRLAYARLLQAQVQLQGIDGELQIAQTTLQALTQIRVSTDIEVDRDLAKLPLYGEVERIAIEQQANVQLKRQNIEVAKLSLRAEKIADRPIVSFRVETDLLDHGTADSVRAGFSIESRFEGLGFVTRGRIKGSESRLAAAQYDLDNVLNDTRRLLNTLMQNRQIQKSLMKMQTLTVEAMQETLDSFLRQYDSGRKTWLEVLNTQRELTGLQLQRVQTENDWLVSSLRVAALIGNLDEQAGINMVGKYSDE